MLERLQKIISRAGIASRRHAEDLIRSGQVRVNGQVVTTLGAKADAERDRIEAAGKLVQISSERAYLVLHKPPQVVTSLADPEGRRSLRHLLVGVSERVYPVGRLDYAASGIVFLTSDGELARRMFEASYHLPQTYWVKVKGRLSEEQVRSLARALRGRVRLLRSPRAAARAAVNAAARRHLGAPPPVRAGVAPVLPFPVTDIFSANGDDGQAPPVDQDGDADGAPTDGNGDNAPQNADEVSQVIRLRRGSRLTIIGA